MTLRLEQLDFDKRMSVESEIEKFWDLSNKVPEEINAQNCTYAAFMPTIAFDESDTYLCYGSPIGLKVLNTRTNTLSRLLGKLESTERFLQLALYQGKPVKQQASSATVNVHSKSSVAESKLDPTFICSAFKKSRFYLFTQRRPTEMPDHTDQASAEKIGIYGRDVHNESLTQKLVT